MWRAIWVEVFIVLEIVGALWDIRHWLPIIERWFQ